MTIKNRHTNDYDLYDDVIKIRAALMDTASDVKGKAGEMINESVENVREKTDLVKNTVADYTAERPFKSLGIALVVGIGIGFLIKK